MLAKNTVFVLGAGASIPYGFPSGLSLLHRTIERTPQGLDQDLGLYLASYQTQDLDALLRATQQESLDAVLERQPTAMQDAGKLVIAKVILECELDHIRAPSLDVNGDWFRYLFSSMADGTSSIEQFLNLNRFHFVTFNYDRLIEQKLGMGLVSAFPGEQLSWDQVGSRVVHLHGWLGSPWTPSLPDVRVPFGALTGNPRVEMGNVLEHVPRAAKSIKIIHQAQPTDAGFTRARELLGQAEFVVFLGFGFGKTNVHRLDFSCMTSVENIFTTCFGMTESEWQRSIASPFQSVGLAGRITSARDFDIDCRSLLRRHAHVLFAD